jgi:hypothetical protein
MKLPASSGAQPARAIQIDYFFGKTEGASVCDNLLPFQVPPGAIVLLAFYEGR